MTARASSRETASPASSAQASLLRIDGERFITSPTEKQSTIYPALTTLSNGFATCSISAPSVKERRSRPGHAWNNDRTAGASFGPVRTRSLSPSRTTVLPDGTIATPCLSIRTHENTGGQTEIEDRSPANRDAAYVRQVFPPTEGLPFSYSRRGRATPPTKCHPTAGVPGNEADPREPGGPSGLFGPGDSRRQICSSASRRASARWWKLP